MGLLVTARTNLAAVITRRRDDLEGLNDEREEHEELDPFVLNEFEIVESYLPIISLKDLAALPRVVLVGLGSDQSGESRGNEGRRKLCVVDQPIQVALQAKINPQDDAEIQQFVELFEQLQECARESSVRGLTWLRNVGLKDRNGTPYDFVKLRESHTFEGIFTAYYRRGIH